MPLITDQTPLLTSGNGHGDARSFPRRFVNILKAEGEPSWLASYKFFIFGSWWNILLLFVPLSYLSHALKWDAALRFSFSFMAIMPLAAVRHEKHSSWLQLLIVYICS